MSTPPRLIGLDWGTTRLRAYLLGAGGERLDQRDDGPGIMSVPAGGFADALEDVVGDWVSGGEALPIIASGMVGSRQGWFEVPYLPCPAGLDAVAAALCEGPRTGWRGTGAVVHLVPGLSCVDRRGVPDVMRGEETQILGAMAGSEGAARGPGLALLPGTHSKWVWMEGDRVERFSTFMTGEVFGLLAEHSILARLMRGREWEREAFVRGVKAVLDAGGASGGGLLRHLFSARTLPLFDALPQPCVHAYLSGLLIGTELHEALGMQGQQPPPARITVIGGDALVERYLVALEVAGIAARRAPPECAALGHAHIARRAGLI